jgi:hypothetical protein
MADASYALMYMLLLFMSPFKKVSSSETKGLYPDLLGCRIAQELIWFPVSDYPYFCYASLSLNHQAEENGEAQSDATD